MGHEDKKQFVFGSLYCLLFQNLNRKPMFAVLRSDIKSLKSGLLNLTGWPYCKKGRSARVKDGIINLILRNYLVECYSGVRRKHVICVSAYVCIRLCVYFQTIR